MEFDTSQIFNYLKMFNFPNKNMDGNTRSAEGDVAESSGKASKWTLSEDFP